MIFAHGPGSFVTTHLTRKWWAKNISEECTKKLYWLGAILGVSVDLDMAYNWFVDSRGSHRDYITHTPFLHILITVLLAIVAFFSQNKKAIAVSKVYFIATITHLVLDSFIGGVMWLFPLSREFFGLMLFDNIAFSFFGQNALYINFIAEGLLFVLAAVILLYVFFERKQSRQIVAISLILFWGLFAAGMMLVAQKTYRIGGNITLVDSDGDGIPNRSDFDMDGDGIENIDDQTPSGDERNINESIVESARAMEGVHFDPSSGKLYELTGRFGFFSEKDVIDKALGHSGVFMGAELSRDYEMNPEEYIGAATDRDFGHKIENYYVFFKHRKKIQYEGPPQLEMLQPGDIIIYDQNAAIIESLSEDDARVLVLHDGAPGKIVEWVGSPVARAQKVSVIRLTHL